MSDTINEVNAPPVVELSFLWSPQTTFTYAPGWGGLGFSAPGARVALPLAFVASAVISNDPLSLLSIVQWEWDFGDGRTTYGQHVNHTYTLVNPYAMTTLRVTDSTGRQWLTRAQMYLS